VNRSFENIVAESFSGEIVGANFMGANFQDCTFAAGTTFTRCRLDRVEFIDCLGLDDVVLGPYTRADNATEKNGKKPWKPKEVDPTAITGKSKTAEDTMLEDTYTAREAEYNAIADTLEAEGDAEGAQKFRDKANKWKAKSDKVKKQAQEADA
jgi:hypothetical protein